MKGLGNLYDQIRSIENLRLADEKARRRKLRSYRVQRHDKNRDGNLLCLQEMLLTQTYKIPQYDVFTIYEPKEQQIFRLPYFPDRVTHHAIMNVPEPTWVSIFTSDTYSCIRNRGIYTAVKRAKYGLKTDPEGTIYCLKTNVRKPYSSIDHDALKQVIRRRIKDKRLL